jgi:hypothetical protein
VQAPAVAWAFLVPGLIIHTTFGILSGLVSSPLIRALAAGPPGPASPTAAFAPERENVTPDVTGPGPEIMAKEET